MKIIHVADIHVGSSFQALSGEKSAKRKSELLEHFQKLAIYAKAEGVRAVLIAGDLFDTSAVDKRLIREVFYCMESAKPVVFYYAQGNHDEYARLENSPDNLKFFPSGQGFYTYALGEGVTLTGANSAELSQTLFSSLVLDEKAYNIMLLHGDIYHPYEREGIPLEALRNKGIDYLALGHIHKPMESTEKLDGRGVYRYAGCLESRGFDECGRRGFFLLEIENGERIKEEFLSFSKRRVVSVQVDVTGLESYYELERRAVSALEPYANDLVKVTLMGKRSPLLKKEVGLLVERLNERCFFAKLEDESRLALDLEGLENDLSEAGEFIKEAGRYELSAELYEEALEIGLKAIYGEEIDL